MANNLTNPTDGHAQIIGEMSFNDGTTTTVLPVQRYLQSLHVVMGSNVAWAAEITLFDAADELEQAFLVAGINGLFTFQWGWDNPQGLSGCPKYTGTILRILPSFTPQGSQYKLCLVPSPVAGEVAGRLPYALADGEPLLNAVMEVVENRGYATTDLRGNPTIQPTPSLAAGAISTNNETDLKFLRGYIASHALDAQGRGGFTVFVDEGNALHFHNAYFVKPILAAYYNCFRDAGGEVREFSPLADLYFVANAGGGNNTYQGLDSEAKARLEVATTSQAGVPGVATSALAGAEARVDLGTGNQGAITIVEREESAFKARVAVQYARLSQLYCTARLVVRGTHAATVGDYIAVDYFRRDGSKHPLSGLYRVQGFIHDWTSAGWYTDFDLTRDGFSKIPDAVGMEVDVVIAPQQTVDTQTSSGGGQGQSTAGVEAHPVAGAGPARQR